MHIKKKCSRTNKKKLALSILLSIITLFIIFSLLLSACSFGKLGLSTETATGTSLLAETSGQALDINSEEYFYNLKNKQKKRTYNMCSSESDFFKEVFALAK